MASSSSSPAPFDILSVVQSVTQTAAETDVPGFDVLNIVAETANGQEDDDVDVMSVVASATGGKRKKRTKEAEKAKDIDHTKKGSDAAREWSKKLHKLKRDKVR